MNAGWVMKWCVKVCKLAFIGIKLGFLLIIFTISMLILGQVKYKRTRVVIIYKTCKSLLA